MILLRLFYEFFKIGLFSLGGGLVTVPFLKELADSTGWFTYQTVTDMIAISESTPGPIGINMATYTGYIVAGIPGAIVATLGEIAPGIIIVAIVFKLLSKFRDNKYVDAAFYGIRPCSTGLIAASGYGLILVALFNMEIYEKNGNLLESFRFKAIILAIVVWVLTNVVKQTKKLHPIVFIAASALVGILFSFAGV